MKKILLIIALAGITVSGGYAQNIDGSCKKKTTYHKAVQHKAIAKARVSNKSAAQDCPVALTTQKKISDSINNNTFSTQSTYFGYYPPNTNRGIDVNTPTPSCSTILVSSSAFANFGPIPAKYTCEGTRVSPPLTIGKIPPKAKSLAIIMYDPNTTPKGNHTYWLVWDVDTTSNIPENFVNDHMTMNSANEYGYDAVCPVAGKHYYHFVVYALDTKLTGGRYSTKASIESSMKGHILGQGELVGVYNRGRAY